MQASSEKISYIQFVRQNGRFLSFGFMLMMFTGFGQTFFFGLFNAPFRETFGITDGEYGTYYSLATLISSFSLMYVGSKIDHMPLDRYITATCLAMVVGCLLIASSSMLWVLILGLFLVRFCCHGLMGHAASTSMARYFDSGRGRAVSFSFVGLSFAEGLFPILMVILLATIDWRWAWGAAATFMLFLGLPALMWSLKGHGDRHSMYLQALEGEDKPTKFEREHSGQYHWSRKQVVKDWRFWTLAPGMMAYPALVTAIFFYQDFIARDKGWSLTAFAGSFLIFAIVKVFSGLMSGTLVDRFSGRQLVIFINLPLMAAFAILMSTDSPFALTAMMVLIGIGIGILVPTGSALTAELYGTRHMGSIKALTSFLMVLSTAMTPILFGALIDAGFSSERLFLIMLTYTAFGVALKLVTLPHLHPRPPR